MSNTILTPPTGRQTRLYPDATPRQPAPATLQLSLDWVRGFDYGRRGLLSVPIPPHITDKLAWLSGWIEGDALRQGSGGERLRLVSEQEALQWLEEHDADPETVGQYFSVEEG